MNKVGISGFWIKIIALITMTVDHIGFILFPNIIWLRYIGRIAFPIFAFFIAEGCKYTKNRLKRFLIIFILGAICEIGYIIFMGGWYGNILLTFSLSIILIYITQEIKNNIFIENKSTFKIVFLLLLVVLGVVGVWFFDYFLGVDYGFWGVMLPVAVSLFDSNRINNPPLILRKIDNHFTKMFLFCLMLIIMAFQDFSFHVYALMSIPLLLIYNGKQGKLKMKYFFYIYYPLHFVVLQLLSFL